MTNQIQNPKSKIRILLILFYLIAITVLAGSVILSGYFFQFNADEVFNANTIYLMTKGFKPYVDFYTVYSPIIHWVLTPVFWLFGFNFQAISVARIVMIFLFFIRLILMFLLVAKVFGRRVGYLFVPLYLMSPFVVFSEMQIRPDNLMMVFYTLFLLIFSEAVIPSESEGSSESFDFAQDKLRERKYVSIKSRLDSSPSTTLRVRMTMEVWYFLSGIFFAVTLLVNIKILPSLAAFSLVFFFSVLQKKQLAKLAIFLNGFCLTFLAFIAYFFLKGYAGQMFLHVFLDPFRLNNSIPYPTWLGYFYFTNPTIYGLEGKPMNWIYTWSLPVLAFAGAYHAVRVKADLLKIILLVSLVFQWVSMLFINSVFIQYYIPLNWLYAVFAAYLINDLLTRINGLVLPQYQKAPDHSQEMNGFGKRESPSVRGFSPALYNLGSKKPPTIAGGASLQKILTISFMILFILLYKSSIEANLARAKITSDPIIREVKESWKMIPEDSPAFPNVIFRRPIYQVLWGSTFAPYMRERYPPAYVAIEKYKIPTLIGLNDEYFSYLDVESQQYIQTHYQRDALDKRIWRRKVK